MSAHSGMLAAVNRPPGCGAAIGMMLSGFERSPGGLSLMDATSKDADDAGAEDADWSCADAVVAASRRATPITAPALERYVPINRFAMALSFPFSRTIIEISLMYVERG